MGVQRTVSVKPINWIRESFLILITGGLWLIVTTWKLINRAATR